MKKFFLLFVAVGLLGCLSARAQVTRVLLDATTNGTTVPAPGWGFALYDEGGDAAGYTAGHDYRITLESNCDSTDTTGLGRLSVYVKAIEFDITDRDTLYIYDGPNITSPLLMKRTMANNDTEIERVFVSASNTAGKLTIRFFAAPNRDTSLNPQGFHIVAECTKPCEQVKAFIDSTYDRINLHTGEKLGTGRMKYVPENLDTIYLEIEPGVYDSTQIVRIDTISMVLAALLCKGQGVRFHGHGEYTHNTGYYNPRDVTSKFCWNFGPDTVYQIAATDPRYDGFQTTDCSDVTLSIIDENGCTTKESPKIQVRVAQNPIKTIYDLTTICNNDSLMVNVGYDGENGTLTLKKIKFAKVVTKVNEVRTFLPDGVCGQSCCYDAPVTFTEFGSGRRITSASDICSICINYEHTFMGDYRVSIECPIYDDVVSTTNYKAVLKYGKSGGCGTCDPEAPNDSPDGTSAGGGTDVGWATHRDGSPVCDSLKNPYGEGLDYCWSRNGQYTLITGDKANVPTRFQSGNWYISNGPTITESVTLHTVPSYFLNGAGEDLSGTYTTRTPSDHVGMLDYYSPASDFSELIGCPLNGEWKATLCDFWGGDNGWIFNWAMDLCGQSGSGGCDYQVAIDSVVWRPDTNYATDFRFGKYTGVQIHPKVGDPTTSYISSPDTAGRFRVKISIYDEFGCRWDTITRISTVYNPEPNLGNDTLLCNVHSTVLDAKDRFSGHANYRYLWSPYGQTTDTIHTKTWTDSDIEYVVEVINESNNIRCPGRDTIHVAVNDQPIPNFDPGTFPLEGCAPFTLNINNTTTYGDKYRWDFGDGVISNEKNPVHSYDTGHFDLKYYVESRKGCKDSLIYRNLVHVYPSPTASFTWDPVFPTVLRPTVNLINTTNPDVPSNKYYWEVQYDRDRNYSFHTLPAHDSSFTWESKSGEDISGNYLVRLITRSENQGPSGKTVTCADTVENTIVLINDYLQFPTVVTPNGDGINDRFVIRNLVEGLAYPHNQLDIYDKWGSRVFHATDISKDDQFWDPATTNTPAGSYFYRFSGKGYLGNIEHNGVIEVLR